MILWSIALAPCEGVRRIVDVSIISCRGYAELVIHAICLLGRQSNLQTPVRRSLDGTLNTEPNAPEPRNSPGIAHLSFAFVEFKPAKIVLDYGCDCHLNSRRKVVLRHLALQFRRLANVNELRRQVVGVALFVEADCHIFVRRHFRSEEHTSELQSLRHLV